MLSHYFNLSEELTHNFPRRYCSGTFTSATLISVIHPTNSSARAILNLKMNSTVLPNFDELVSQLLYPFRQNTNSPHLS